MKLTNVLTSVVLALPNDLLWSDEFSWTPVTTNKSHSLSGALLIEQGVKQAGRPITLTALEDMAWVTRETAMILLSWAALAGAVENAPRVFELEFEYVGDTRSFLVMIESIEAKPVKEFPSHLSSDWFNVSLKLIEVEE